MWCVAFLDTVNCFGQTLKYKHAKSAYNLLEITKTFNALVWAIDLSMFS